jgi:hypothetical protein
MSNNKLSFYVRGGYLYSLWFLSSGKGIRVYPLDNDDFYIRSFSLILTFIKDSIGKVSGCMSKEYPDFKACKTGAKPRS